MHELIYGTVVQLAKRIVEVLCNQIILYYMYWTILRKSHLCIFLLCAGSKHGEKKAFWETRYWVFSKGLLVIEWNCEQRTLL